MLRKLKTQKASPIRASRDQARRRWIRPDLRNRCLAKPGRICITPLPLSLMRAGQGARVNANKDETLPRPSAWGRMLWKPLGHKRRNTEFLQFAGESGFYSSSTSFDGQYLLRSNVVEIQRHFRPLLTLNSAVKILGCLCSRANNRDRFRGIKGEPDASCRYKAKICFLLGSRFFGNLPPV